MSATPTQNPEVDSTSVVVSAKATALGVSIIAATIFIGFVVNVAIGIIWIRPRLDQITILQAFSLFAFVVVHTPLTFGLLGCRYGTMRGYAYFYKNCFREWVKEIAAVFGQFLWIEREHFQQRLDQKLADKASLEHLSLEEKLRQLILEKV
ncbi:MAG: hypothetical protein AAFR59_14605, partial [Bacteroidota bacterium]